MGRARRQTGRRSLWQTYLTGLGLVVLSLFIAVAGPSRPVQAAPDKEVLDFLAIINVYRQDQGLGPLTLSPMLTEAAEWMSQDMADHDYFGHIDSLGRDPFERMAAFGYNFNTWSAENLAAGNAGAQATFDQWRNSPGHNENMLNPNYRVIGIARASGSGAYKWYWTNDFGGYDDSADGATAVASYTSAPVPDELATTSTDGSVTESDSAVAPSEDDVDTPSDTLSDTLSDAIPADQ